MSSTRTRPTNGRSILVVAGLMAALLTLTVQGSALAVPGWSAPTTAVPAPPEPRYLGPHASVLDAAGNVHLAYTVGWASGTLKYATNKSGSWVRTTLTPEYLNNVSVAIALDGADVYIAYSRQGSGTGGIWVATNASGSWQHTRLVPGAYRAAAIQVVDGSIRLAYSGNDGVHYRRFTDTGSVHTMVKAFAEHAQSDNQLLFDQGGKPVVSFSADNGYIYVCRKSGPSFTCDRFDDGHGRAPSMAFDSEWHLHMIWEHWATPGDDVPTGRGHPFLNDGLYYAHDTSGTFLHSAVARGAHLSSLQRTIGIGPNDRPQIVFIWETEIRYAVKTAAGWTYTTLSTQHDLAEYSSASIEVHSDGRARVVYESDRGLDYRRRQ